MATGFLTLSGNTAGAVSTWNGWYAGNGNYSYSTPTTDGQAITVTVPAEMQGATFNSATLTYNVSSASGTRHVRFNGESYEVTSTELLSRLVSGGNLNLYFSFRAAGYTGGEGAHSAYCGWNNITITVDYTPAMGISGTVTVTNAGTAVFSLEKASLAYGESMVLGITARPTRDITEIVTEIRPGSLAAVVSYSTAKAVAANAGAALSYTLEIPSAMKTAMANRVYAAQIRVSFTGANGTTYTSAWTAVKNTGTNKAFNLLKTRAAPVISAVTWGESGTNHISTYGNLIAGKTVPTVNFNVTLDTAADSGIGYESRTLTLGDKAYTLSANSGTLEAVTAGGTVDYILSVTDSYGQTGTVSGTITVLSYTPPTLRNVAISRYISTLDSGGNTVYELSDDGTSLWFDASITCQTALGSGTNAWNLTITPLGGSAITVVSGSTLAVKTYLNDRTVFTGTYPSTDELDFVVELRDAFTTVTYTVNVPKAGGLFNIEKTGVAVGMRSTGTEAQPLFQSAYPAHFHGGVYGASGDRLDEVHDTGWQALTLSNCNQVSGWAACAYRVKEGIVFVRGAVTLSASMSSSSTVSRQLTTLPEGCRPAANMLVNAGSRANISSIEIDADGKVLLWNRIGAAIGTTEVISITAVFPTD